jgi:hypothetical protein
MKRWTVCYSEKRLMEVIVEADTQEEAEAIVNDGEADYDSALELDAHILHVNNSEFLDDSDPDGDDE